MRMIRSILSVALLMLPLSPATAPAGIVCDAVDTMSPFAMVGVKKIRSRAAAGLPSTYCGWGMFYKGPLCSPRVVLNGVNLEPFHLDDTFIVATKTRGTAVSLIDTRKEECFQNSLDDDIITGGGAVNGEPGPYSSPINIDTSGTDPRVAQCNQAFTDAVALSNSIRAMPATHTYENIKIAVGERLEIDATGGGIVRIDSLKLQRIRGYVSYGYNYPCLYAEHDPATLAIIADPEDEVILDVLGGFHMGACAIIEVDPEQFLVNAAGRGKSLRMGPDSFGDFNALNFLAPERTLKLEGSRVGEGTFIGYAWAKKIVTRGLVEMDRPPCLP